MSRRHADIWSHPGHYLADPYTWPWSQNGHSLGHERPTFTPFVQRQSALPFGDNSYPWSRPCVWSKVKVTFDLENSKLKVMAKVKSEGHIWGLGFNQYICFSIRGNRTISGRDIANSIFDLEIQGQGHDEKRSTSNQVICRSGPIIVPKIKEIQNVVQKLSSEQESAAGGGGVRTGTKT